MSNFFFILCRLRAGKLKMLPREYKSGWKLFLVLILVIYTKFRFNPCSGCCVKDLQTPIHKNYDVYNILFFFSVQSYFLLWKCAKQEHIKCWSDLRHWVFRTSWTLKMSIMVSQFTLCFSENLKILMLLGLRHPYFTLLWH